MADLKARIEKLIDTADSPEIDVIVQMGRSNDPLNRFVDIASAALKRRSLVTSARDLLPVGLDSLEHSGGKRISPHWRRILGESEASLVAQSALRRPNKRPAAKLMTCEASKKTLKPLLDSSIIRGSRKRSHDPARPAWLWVAESLR
jgi:hypothetical protein